MNSRLRISNQLELLNEAQSVQARAATMGTRALILIMSPPAGWLERFAQRCQCEFLDAQAVADRADRITALLGSERRMAIMQLGRLPDLGLLAAAAGTLRAGGLMIIGTSTTPASELVSCNNAIPGRNWSDVSHSQQRLQRLAIKTADMHPDTVRCLELSGKHATASVRQTCEQLVLPDGGMRFREPRLQNHDAQAEQDALLRKAINHLNVHARGSSCIVITGRRGRGKSSLLARIALHLDKTGLDFRVTALHSSALSTFHKYVGHTDSRYVSPDSASDTSADVLLVDEAASLSLKLLQHFLVRYRHVVLCTTIEGYEASGRAFDVKLLSNWSHRSMALLQLDAKQSWRWEKDDALEQFTDQLLLNEIRLQPDFADVSTNNDPRVLARQCQLVHIGQSELVSDETLLASVHSLLHQAHYQTTTKDLEHLLDAPSIRLWVQKLDNRVVGALLLEHEGCIHHDLHEPILSRTRRLPNQLLPQLLAQTANSANALDKQYIRIIRLAVSPELRRQKLASRMLDGVIAHYRQPKEAAANLPDHHADAIGASFAADDCSVGFWQSQGFAEFHRGFRLNPRTGVAAVAVMQSFEPSTSDVLSIAAEIYHDNEQARKTTSVNLQQWAVQALSQRDVQLLRRFAAGQRSWHDTYASLQRLSVTSPEMPAVKRPQQGTRQHELVLRRFVQQWAGSQSDDHPAP